MALNTATPINLSSVCYRGASTHWWNQEQQQSICFIVWMGNKTQGKGYKVHLVLFSKSQGFKKWNVWVLESSVLEKRSADDELMSLTAWRMKLLYSLVVQQQMLLYLLSDGSRVNRLWLGGCCLVVSPGSLMLYRCYQWCSGGFNQPL